ncbi:MAG: sulfatase-like hydrolase/transferase, partial [Pirellulales bacterium]|nr:sulfatase-like hydrolase/transferase [Pirellulales bacterium]
MLVRAITLSVILLPVSLFAAETPNVVMIISDDQAFSDYGFMGHETIRTPALDRLADESATFTRGYVPSSLCRPSLMTLATGLYPYQHKISGNDPSGKRGPKAAYAKLREKLISHI